MGKGRENVQRMGELRRYSTFSLSLVADALRAGVSQAQREVPFPSLRILFT